MRPFDSHDKLILVLSLLFTFFAGALGNALAETERTDPIADFMALSGLDHHIQQLPRSYMALIDQIFAGIEKQGKMIPRQTKAVVRQGFLSALDPHVLQQEVRRRLDNTLPAGLAMPVGEWLRADLGRRITALEKEASSPEAAVQLAAFMLQLQMESPSAERMGLVRRLEDLTGNSAYAVDVWETVTVTLSSVILATGTDIPPGGREPIRQKLATLRPSMKALFQQAALLHILFTYRALTDAELTRYADFLQSKTGREIVTIVKGAVKDAATTAIARMEPALIDSLMKDHKKT